MNEIIANLKHAARNGGASIGGGEFSPAECRQAAAALTHAAELLSCLRELQLAVTMRPMGQTGLSARERTALDAARIAIAKATNEAE